MLSEKLEFKISICLIACEHNYVTVIMKESWAEIAAFVP